MLSNYLQRLSRFLPQFWRARQRLLSNFSSQCRRFRPFQCQSVNIFTNILGRPCCIEPSAPSPKSGNRQVCRPISTDTAATRLSCQPGAPLKWPQLRLAAWGLAICSFGVSGKRGLWPRNIYGLDSILSLRKLAGWDNEGPSRNE